MAAMARPLLLLLPLLTLGCGRELSLGEAQAAAPPPPLAAAVPLPAPEAETPATVARRAETVWLNQAILDALATYSRGAAHPYVWSKGVNTDGVTQELYWRGTLLAAPEADGGIHCSGITYEVYLKALASVVGEDAGPSAETLLTLKDTWYVRDGQPQGPVAALVDADLGEPVDGLAALKPGDIVQFWRNNGKGHSVVFISHTRNTDGSLRGMTYWSAQGTSGGIGMRRVSPGPDINQIAEGRLWGVRAKWSPDAG